MSVVRLDHATLNVIDLDKTIEFYRHFLGLEPGYRPDFGFGGAWLYPKGGDYPILHLLELKPTEYGPTGMFDHLAFRLTDVKAYIKMLQDEGCWFEAREVTGTPLCQVHHFDPNGICIEATFEEPLDTDVVDSDPSIKRPEVGRKGFKTGFGAGKVNLQPSDA